MKIKDCGKCKYLQKEKDAWVFGGGCSYINTPLLELDKCPLDKASPNSEPLSSPQLAEGYPAEGQ